MNGPLERDGYDVAADVVPEHALQPLRRLFGRAVEGRAGTRNGLAHTEVRDLVAMPGLRELVANVLGPGAVPHRASLLDKSTDTNWFVAWHQDLVVPVSRRVDAPGYGPWSRKGDTWFVQPPASLLQHLLAVRIDLDGSDHHNGALRVLPGTHREGVLPAQRIADLARTVAPVTATCAPGGAVLLRPLLLHASAKARRDCHRRIVHLEYCPAALVGQLQPRDVG